MNTNNILIRETTASDFDYIMAVEKQAFGYDKEAELTADLLVDPSGEPAISLLAFYHDEPVGHILFARVYFSGQ